MTADRAPIYLDANATVPVLEEARAALLDAALALGNPSSPHALGRAARRRLDVARAHIASALGGAPKQIVLLSGAAEANRWLVDALAARGDATGDEPNVVTSPLEHPSLRRPLRALADAGHITLHVLRATEDGALHDDDDVVAQADAIFVTAAHNETGVRPLLSPLLERAPQTAVICCDASQLVGRGEPLADRVDAIVASAHKMGGVSGAGALLLRGNAATLPSPWPGPQQEGGRRPGTEAVALHAAFGAAAAVIERTRERHAALAPLRDRLERELTKAWGARVIGATGERLPNTTALLVPDVDGDALRLSIDASGVCVGFGSACSALAPEPSESLLALGLTREQARATVRLSLAPGADDDLIDEAIGRLAGALPR